MIRLGSGPRPAGGRDLVCRITRNAIACRSVCLFPYYNFYPVGTELKLIAHSQIAISLATKSCDAWKQVADGGPKFVKKATKQCLGLVLNVR